MNNRTISQYEMNEQSGERGERKREKETRLGDDQPQQLTSSERPY
jgi:hypothetical protein